MISSLPAASRLSVLVAASFLYNHSARCQMSQIARLKSPLYVSWPKAQWCSCCHLLLGATKRFYGVEFSHRGAVQLAGTLISATNKKQTRLPPSPLPRVCRCGPSLTSFHIPPLTMQLSCLPPAAWGGKPRRVCVKHTHTQATHKTAAVRAPEEKRDAAQTNMSAPQARTANGPSRKPLLLWRRQE